MQIQRGKSGLHGKSSKPVTKSQQQSRQQGAPPDRQIILKLAVFRSIAPHKHLFVPAQRC